MRRWIKIWTQEWLEGSIRFDLTPEERSVWCDLLNMAATSRNLGVIQANPDVPYPHDWLAHKFNIPLELLNRTLEKCVSQGRVTENSHGIEIVNWSIYQTSYEVGNGERIKAKKKATSIKKIATFADLKKTLEKAAPNERVAILVDAFRYYHKNAPQDDLEHTGGRIAGILKTVSNDYGYLAKLIVETSAGDITGSHLNYIQGKIRRTNDKTKSRELPDSYTESRGDYPELGGPELPA